MPTSRRSHDRRTSQACRHADRQPVRRSAVLAAPRTTLGSILGAGLLLLLIAERRHLARAAPADAVPALGRLGGHRAGLLAGRAERAPADAALTALIVWQGLREYARLVGLPPLYRTVLLHASGCWPCR